MRLPVAAALAAVALVLAAAPAHCGLSPRHGLAAARTAGGRLALLAVDSNRFVRRADQARADEASFGAWADLGGIATSQPALGVMSDGFEVVLVRGESNTVMAKWAMTGTRYALSFIHFFTFFLFASSSVGRYCYVLRAPRVASVLHFLYKKNIFLIALGFDLGSDAGHKVLG
jgi:hypothetical protein